MWSVRLVSCFWRNCSSGLHSRSYGGRVLDPIWAFPVLLCLCEFTLSESLYVRQCVFLCLCEFLFVLVYVCACVCVCNRRPRLELSASQESTDYRCRVSNQPTRFTFCTSLFIRTFYKSLLLHCMNYLSFICDYSLWSYDTWHRILLPQELFIWHFLKISQRHLFHLFPFWEALSRDIALDVS